MSHFPNTRREVFLTFCKVFQTEDRATFSHIKLDYLPEKHFKLTLKCVENWLANSKYIHWIQTDGKQRRLFSSCFNIKPSLTHD